MGFKNLPSFIFKDDNEVPDKDNKLYLIFTVYDSKGKEYHFAFTQSMVVDASGNFDYAQTYRYILSNLCTYDRNLKMGILTEAQTIEAIAKLQAASTTTASETTTTPSTTTTTAGNTTDSTVNHGSVA